MGTQYRVINVTKKEVYGFGLDWNPKYTEAIINRDPARFLLFLMLEACRKDYIVIIHEGNGWDWETEVPNLWKNYTDKTEEMQQRYAQWDKEENEVTLGNSSQK